MAYYKIQRRNIIFAVTLRRQVLIFLFSLSVMLLATTERCWCESALLTGTPIGSSPSVDYNTFGATTTKNLPADAFDGDLSTFYASYERSYTWVGLDLGTRHIIHRAGWSPRNDGVGPNRLILGVIEGANESDFSDALPLYLIDKAGTIGQISFADIDCSLGFRYVRYVGPAEARCNIAELQFFGEEGEGDSTVLYRPTNLPCVVIHTEGQQEPYDKVHYVNCISTVIGTDGSVLQDTAGLRLRGNASINFPKKPYQLKFVRKHHILGSPAKAKKWTLINNYGDKTLMRNIVAFHVSECSRLTYTPFCEAVDVFVNGEYKGCYQFCDKIEVRKGRIDIAEMDSTDLSGEALSGGYMWEIDGYAYNEPQPYYTPQGMPINLHDPEDDDILQVQRQYFENYFASLESAVYASSDINRTWRSYIDFPSFARYFLTNEVCGNPDVFWSTYMYKQRGDRKAYTGPVWDFDIAFDNDHRIYPISSHSTFIYGGAYNAEAFAKHILFADTQSREDLLNEWHLMRNHGITVEELLAFVDSVADALNASQRLNFLRWQILSQRVHENPVALGSYTAEVNRLKQFISMRVSQMDRFLGYTYHTAAPVISTDETEGTIQVYTISGIKVYEGTAMPALPEGIYIIRKGSKTIKIYQP